MPDFKINDDWVLNRVSSQSNSFSDWLSSLLKNVEEQLADESPEVLDQLKKDKDFSSLKDLDKELTKAQEELANLGFFGKKVTSFGMKILDFVKIPIEKELKKSFQEIGVDFDFRFFSNEKKKTFERLNSGESFPKTTINLQDVKTSEQKRKKKEDIIAHDTIII